MLLRARVGVDSDSVRQRASHVLHVEGKGESAFDAEVVRELLRDIVDVRPLGPASHLASVAQALHPHHPDWYFLVDRDHHDDEYVERCWRNFPARDTHNLLIWRRRELESYFIIPEYIARSEHLKGGWTERQLREHIVALCQRRIFMTAANLVIIHAREEGKRNWIECFTDPAQFTVEDDAVRLLLARPELQAKLAATRRDLEASSLERQFHQTLSGLTGGTLPLEFGHGRWLELIPGAEVLSEVVSKSMTVRGSDNRTLQGDERLREVVKGLARLPLDQQPADFQELFGLVEARVKGG